MTHKSESRTISWFQAQYKGTKLTLRPPFQRKPVWTDKQRCTLIESILLDVPIPEVYVQVTQDDEGGEEFGVVDGQQRLRTILQFVGIETTQDQKDSPENNNNFGLDDLPATSPHLGKAFADMSVDARKKFFQYDMCVRFLYTEKMSEIEDVFKRLNKFAMPLKPQELRNATYHGPFAKLSEVLADDEYWAVNRIVSPAAIRRMADIEMMSDLLIGLLHGPQGGSARIIDQYYEMYEPCEDEFPNQNRAKHTFDRVRQCIERVFPDINDVIRWGNRADFYTLFVALGASLPGNEIRPKDEKELGTELLRLAGEVDERLENNTSAGISTAAKKYARAIEKGSNDRARRVDRHDVVMKIIKPFLTPLKK